jgi:hypothetical protein
MCAQFNFSVLVLVAAFSWCVAAHGKTPPDEIIGGCEKNNECVAFFSKNHEASRKLCESQVLSVAWSKGADEYLFQCQDESTSEENVNWVVIQKHDSIIGLNYGRLVSKRFMLDNSRGEIPGKFGATTLCEPASAGKILPSNFILLRKRPINGDSPYCYDITYLVIKNGELNVEINNGNVKDGDPRYFLPPVSSVERSNLNKLLHEILMWISRQS